MRTLLTQAVAVDIETSALSPDQGEIIRISACHISAEGVPGEVFDTFVCTSKPISNDVVRLTGISNDVLRSAPGFSAVAPAFLRFIGNWPLYSWHVEFEAGFLNSALTKAGLAPLPGDRFVDLPPPSEAQQAMRHASALPSGLGLVVALYKETRHRAV